MKLLAALLLSVTAVGCGSKNSGSDTEASGTATSEKKYALDLLKTCSPVFSETSLKDEDKFGLLIRAVEQKKPALNSELPLSNEYAIMSEMHVCLIKVLGFSNALPPSLARNISLLFSESGLSGDQFKNYRLPLAARSSSDATLTSSVKLSHFVTYSKCRRKAGDVFFQAKESLDAKITKAIGNEDLERDLRNQLKELEKTNESAINQCFVNSLPK